MTNNQDDMPPHQGLNIAPASTGDYRLLAQQRLPQQMFDYIDGGACDEVTMRANVADFQKISLKQSVMRDVSSIDTGTTLLGERIDMPLALAPVGLSGLMSRRAEVEAVKVANKAGVPFCLSTVSICSLEEVAAAANRPFWFQLYMMKDRGYVEQLLARAEAVGCSTLVFTVDLAVLGARYRDVRNGLIAPKSLRGSLKRLIDIVSHPRWVMDVPVRGKPLVFGNLAEFVPDAHNITAFADWVDNQFDASVTWKDIEWLRSIWKGRIVIKGVLEPEDAVAAAAAGADAVIVSNHGGRQLDGVGSGIAKLPAVVEAISGGAEILVDGGIRSGQDITRALALGANASLIGRPWIWSMAASGGDGLTQLLATMKNDMHIAMALTGVTSVAEISADILDNRVTGT